MQRGVSTSTVLLLALVSTSPGCRSSLLQSNSYAAESWQRAALVPGNKVQRACYPTLLTAASIVPCMHRGVSTSTVLPLALVSTSPGCRLPTLPLIMFSQDAEMMCTCAYRLLGQAERTLIAPLGAAAQCCTCSSAAARAS